MESYCQACRVLLAVCKGVLSCFYWLGYHIQCVSTVNCDQFKVEKWHNDLILTSQDGLELDVGEIEPEDAATSLIEVNLRISDKLHTVMSDDLTRFPCE